MKSLGSTLIGCNFEQNLFTEFDCDKTFDEMIQNCYDLHPANFFLDIDNKNLNEESCLEPMLKIEASDSSEMIATCKPQVISNFLTKDKKFKTNCDPLIESTKEEIAMNNQNLDTSKEDRVSSSPQSSESCGEEIIENITSSIKQPRIRGSIIRDLTEVDSCLKMRIKLGDSTRIKRWGKNEDIEMFKLLKKGLEHNKISEKAFFNEEIEEVLDHKTLTIKDSVYSEIIEELTFISNWLRTPYHLLCRIVKLSENQKFSVRDENLLKILISSKKNNDQIYFKEISSYFPGKFEETVIEKITSLSKRRK